jgi:hypothetical protein
LGHPGIVRAAIEPAITREDRASRAVPIIGETPVGRRWILLGLILVVLVLAGLSLEPLALRPIARLPPVPVERTLQAVIPGIPGARYFVALDIQPMIKDVVAARERELASRAQTGESGALPPAHLLAVSGGGDNGPRPPGPPAY